MREIKKFSLTEVSLTEYGHEIGGQVIEYTHIDNPKEKVEYSEKLKARQIADAIKSVLLKRIE